MWQTQRRPCSDCAVWAARAQHHPGGPALTVSFGCKACPLHTAPLFPRLLQGELTWGPVRGASTWRGAWPEHCLPKMSPAAPSPHTPGLGTPPRGHTDISLNVSVLGGPPSYTPCPGLPVTLRLCATTQPRPTSSRPPGVTHSPLARAPLRPLSSALCPEPLPSLQTQPLLNTEHFRLTEHMLGTLTVALYRAKTDTHLRQ